MKRYLYRAVLVVLFAVLVLGLWVGAVAASAIGWEMATDLGTPDRVDMYPRGAEVTWVIPAEREMVLVAPSSFLPERLRYHMLEGAVIHELEASYQAALGWTPPGLRDLTDEVDRLRLQIRSLQAELLGVEQTIAYLDAGAAWEEASDPIGLIVGIQTLRVTTEREKTELVRDIQEKEQQLRAVMQNLRQSFAGDLERLVRVQLRTNGVGSIALTLFSPYARWVPLYKASLDSNASEVTLQSHVSAQQQTGMLWDGAVHAHTAAPTDRVDVPVVRPLVARIEEPGVDHMPPGVRRDAKVMMESALMDAPPPDMVQIEGEASITFAGRGRVASDNRPTLLDVGEEVWAVEARPTLVPYQEEQAWLLAETVHPVRALLPGMVDLTVDGSFSGTTMLNHRGAGEPLQMAFGRSPLITAERKPIVYVERQTWLGRRVLRDGYQIMVHNGTAREATILVQDRVPVPGHDRLKITVSVEPEAEEAEGILSWTLVLDAGESAEIRVGYEIEYPDRMDLIIR